MNTVKKGDQFEKIGIELIHKLICEQQILIDQKFIRQFSKKKYPCRSRNGMVEFDYVIEVWAPNAERCSLYYFIECKDYKSRVGVDKLKKFHNDIQEVTGANAKAIFITKSLLQEGAKSYADANGFMVIQANSVADYKIIFHKKNIKENDIPTLLGKINDVGILGLSKIIDKQICKVLEKFSLNTSYGIDIIRKSDIEALCNIELDKINPKILTDAKSINVSDLKEYLNKQYNIKIYYHNSNDLLGFYDIDKNIISLHVSVYNTKQELFILCHEFGHFKLHQNLIIDQFTYNNFNESEFNFKIGKNSLTNPRHWIEWQANYFSICMILPKTSIIALLLKNQIELGIKQGELFLDDQKFHYLNYQTILYNLSQYFNVTRPNIIYRLKELKHFKNNSNVKSAKEILEQMRMDSHI